MPNYNAQNPPFIIFPGDNALAFNAESPAPPQASQQFALPEYAGFPDQGRTVRWQISFASAPTSVSVQLQAANQDVDAQYQTIDSSTATSGEARTLAGSTAVRAKFLRAKLVSQTGGGAITVQILA